MGGEVLEGRIVQVVEVENLASMLCTLTKAPLPYKNPNENNVIGMCSRTRLFWTLQPTMRIRPPGESGSLEPNNVWFKRWGEKTFKMLLRKQDLLGLQNHAYERSNCCLMKNDRWSFFHAMPRRVKMHSLHRDKQHH